MRQERCVPRTGQPQQLGRRQRLREPRRRLRRRQRVALAGDDERRGSRCAQRRRAGPRRRARRAPRSSIAGSGSPRAKSWCRSAASVACPASLPCTCSDRKRCSVSRHATRELVAEAGERLRRHRVRPRVVGDEARRGRDQHELARGGAGARAPRRARSTPPSDQPITASGCCSVANARSSAATTASMRPGLDRIAVAVARQVDDVDAMVLRERGQERREQPAVQREAVQQHEGASLPDGLDVQARYAFTSRRATARPRRAHAASASAASSASTSSSVCAAENDTRSRAVPCGTVGGRIAGTKMPRSHNVCDSATAAAASPSTSGWIGVVDGSSVHGNAAAPARKRAIVRARRARRACPSRIAASEASDRAGEQRRLRGRVDVRAPGLHQRLDHRGMRGDERARHARGLAERAHVDDALVGEPEVREAAAALAQHAEPVRVVDDEPGVVRPRQLEQRGQRREVAVHREHRVGRDQLARRRRRREPRRPARRRRRADSGSLPRATGTRRRRGTRDRAGRRRPRRRAPRARSRSRGWRGSRSRTGAPARLRTGARSPRARSPLARAASGVRRRGARPRPPRPSAARPRSPLPRAPDRWRGRDSRCWRTRARRVRRRRCAHRARSRSCAACDGAPPRAAPRGRARAPRSARCPLRPGAPGQAVDKPSLSRSARSSATSGLPVVSSRSP